MCQMDVENGKGRGERAREIVSVQGRIDCDPAYRRKMRSAGTIGPSKSPYPLCERGRCALFVSHRSILRWRPATVAGMLYSMSMDPEIVNDTSAEAEQVLIDGYRNMSPARKLQRVFDLSETLRQLSRQRIVERYGTSLSEREIKLKLAALYLDKETMVAAFGYDPDNEDT